MGQGCCREGEFQDGSKLAPEAQSMKAVTESALAASPSIPFRTSMMATTQPARRLQSAFSSGKESQMEGAPDAVVLYWSLGPDCNADHNFLQRLHAQIRSCIDIFSVEVLMDDATSGLVRGLPVSGENLSAADVAVRVGHILCRWAAGETPAASLVVGVHVGQLEGFRLPNTQFIPSFFGEAVSEAKQLAHTAKDRTVHLSDATKERLVRLQKVPLALSPDGDSYFLDARTNVMLSSTASDSALQTVEGTGVVVRTRKSFSDTEDRASFVSFLDESGVDTSLFGKGSAMTLEDFYKLVVVDKLCHLDMVQINKDTCQLERSVTVVRVSIRARNASHEVMELTRKALPRGDEKPLELVLKDDQEDSWKTSLERYFTAHLGIGSTDHKAHFNYEFLGSVQERSSAELLPGIVTTYKTLYVKVEIADRAAADLAVIGLPTFSPFSPKAVGGKKDESWKWKLYDREKEDDLLRQLQGCGIEVSDFAPNAFAELYDEVHVKKLSRLTQTGQGLVRTIRVLKVLLRADIFGVEHGLVIRAKYQKGEADQRDSGNSLSMRFPPESDWKESIGAALALRLGLSKEMQEEYFYIDIPSHQVTEEIATSRTYPGLKTVYEVNTVQVWVSDSMETKLACIGLPGGTDFTFARREKNSRVEGDGDLVITQWSWTLIPKDGAHADGPRVSVSDSNMEDMLSSNSATKKPPPRRKSPSPNSSVLGDVLKSGPYKGVYELAGFLQHAKCDWTAAKRAAEQIRDPVYTCRFFHDDVVAAFPELLLYCTGDSKESAAWDDEYQRTIGALFAFFWLMRMDIDGKQGFCYGVDDKWAVRNPEAEIKKADANNFPTLKADWTRRRQFHDSIDWKAFQQLVVNAKLLQSPTGPHDVERTLAMLVLLAMHDIMKVPAIQPQVIKSSYSGFKVGERITDHDTALSYVLTTWPSVLPSYAGLGAKSKQCVQFTLCKLEYNMGWLVQAEAPPGPLLRTFRKVVTTGKVSPADIAFYFVRWLTDLAGAEPFPLEGCEKFVLKFPQKIFEQFIETFSFIGNLSASVTETDIVEDYLRQRWHPTWGPAPQGEGAIAQMRVVCMAQGDTAEIVEHYLELSQDDRRVLDFELAITGCKGQSFRRDVLKDSSHKDKGPAFLVYYSPALLQKAGKKDGKGALSILAEVLRKSRNLWPLTAKDGDKSVTVRIELLKGLEVSEIVTAEPGKHFVLAKTSDVEASVQLKDISEFPRLDWKKNQVLCLHNLKGTRGTVRRRKTTIR